MTLRGVQSGTLGAAVIVAPLGGVVQNATSLATGNPIAAQILVSGITDVAISNLTIDGSNKNQRGTQELGARVQTSHKTSGLGELKTILDHGIRALLRQGLDGIPLDILGLPRETPSE